MRGGLAFAALLLSACNSGGEHANAARDGVMPAAFAQCAACHSVEPGKRSVGPSLAGVMQRKAGLLPGYAYSSGLVESGLTWDAATLNRFLANPAGVVPGTRMVTAVGSEKDRAAIIAYLSGIKAE